MNNCAIIYITDLFNLFINEILKELFCWNTIAIEQKIKRKEKVKDDRLSEEMKEEHCK